MNDVEENRGVNFSELNSNSPKIEVALKSHEFGFDIIPLIPDEKRPATKWAEWEGNVDENKIRDYWEKHPGHGIGVLTNHKICVLDADTKEADKALCDLEKAHNCFSNFIVKTRKGSHHYYWVPEGVEVKLSAHSTEQHPERLDVKAARSLVVGPHEEGKRLIKCEIDHVLDLTKLTQRFIDDVVTHNGGHRQDKLSTKKPVPKSLPDKTAVHRESVNSKRDPKLAVKLLDHIDPDVGYGDWFIVAAGLHHEFGGDDEGLEVFDTWSKGGAKYTTRHAIEVMWRSLKTQGENR
ncbi:MAG: bifunctional DNA primase/polymerase [Cycloclasticus sp.]|nr:bifunctional DNA primase/polymerase [Cycloclasticus sp.]